jgi:Bacterial RNA polymerase, alpha chain C terminal domain
MCEATAVPTPVRPVLVFLECNRRAVDKIGNDNDFSELIFGVAPVTIELEIGEIGWEARNLLGTENYADFLRKILDAAIGVEGIDVAEEPDWNKNVRFLMLGAPFAADGDSMRHVFEQLFPEASCYRADQHGVIEYAWGTMPSLHVPSNAMYSIPIEELEFGVRAYNCLKLAGIEIVGDLVAKKASELRQLPNFGEGSLDEVVDTLALHNLHLMPEDD